METLQTGRYNLPVIILNLGVPEYRDWFHCPMQTQSNEIAFRMQRLSENKTEFGIIIGCFCNLKRDKLGDPFLGGPHECLVWRGTFCDLLRSLQWAIAVLTHVRIQSAIFPIYIQKHDCSYKSFLFHLKCPFDSAAIV